MPTQGKPSLKLMSHIIEALEISKDGFGIFDPKDILVFCNNELASNFGLNVGDALGKSFEEMLRNSHASGYGVIADNDDVDAMIQRAIKSRLQPGFVSFETERLDGRWMKVSRIRTNDNYLIIYSTEITQLKETEFALVAAVEDIKKLANTDELTNSSNRRHFLEQSSNEFERSKRYGHSLTLLALDIDHFKSVNDTYGHHAGDEVLKEFTKACKSQLRKSDIFGRVGGEEFSILLPDSDDYGAKVTAKRILKSIASLKVNYQDKIINLTVSIGIAEMSTQSQDLAELMKLADEALYRAKHNGRNRLET